MKKINPILVVSFVVILCIQFVLEAMKMTSHFSQHNSNHGMSSEFSDELPPVQRLKCPATQPTSELKTKRAFYSKVEDEKLITLVGKYGSDWAEISKHMPGRTDVSCRTRYNAYLRNTHQVDAGYYKPTTKTISDGMTEQVAPEPNVFSQRQPKKIEGRHSRVQKQNIASSAPWSTEEDCALRRKVDQFGTKWNLIASFLPGRTPNSIKNRWNTIRKKPLSYHLSEF